VFDATGTLVQYALKQLLIWHVIGRCWIKRYHISFFTARSLYIDRETIFGCNLRFRILECLFLPITRNNLEAAQEKQTFQQSGDILSRW